MTTTTEKFSFVKAADAATAIEKKAGGLWNNLAGWTHDILASANVSGDGNVKRDAAKAALEVAEGEYQAAHPKAGKLSSIAAYRSAKSVVLKAILMDVPLVDEKGKVRGKTEVEGDCKAATPDKTELEKFNALFKTLSLVAGKLTGADRADAKRQLKELHDAML